MTTVWDSRVRWQEGFTEEYRFRTEIITSATGREQRIAQRRNPRVNYAFESWTAREGFARRLASLSADQSRAYILPHPLDPARLAQPAQAGDTELVVDRMPRWAATGETVIFGSGEGSTEVSGVSDRTIELGAALQVPMPTGTTLRRGVPGRLEGSAPLDVQTDSHGLISVEFQADVYPSPVVGEPGQAVETFDGVEVFPLAPNWGTNPSIEFERRRETLDLNRGVRDVVSTVPFTDRRTDLAFLLHTPEAQRAVIGMFRRCRGRQRSFFLPSPFAEMIPAGDIASGVRSITVEGEETAALASGSRIYRYIELRSRGADAFRTRVEGVRRDATGNTVLDLRDPIPETSPGALRHLTWLIPTRFASDRLTVEWITDGVARTDITFFAIEETDS